MKTLRNILTAISALCVLYVFIMLTFSRVEQFSLYKQFSTVGLLMKYGDHINPWGMEPISLALLLLAWIIYGFWIRELFRPVAQWNLVQMLQLGLRFCLLCIAFLAVEFHMAFALLLVWHGNMPGPFTAGMFYSKLFAAQIAFFAVLLWWRTSQKPVS